MSAYVLPLQACIALLLDGECLYAIDVNASACLLGRAPNGDVLSDVWSASLHSGAFSWTCLFMPPGSRAGAGSDYPAPRKGHIAVTIPGPQPLLVSCQPPHPHAVQLEHGLWFTISCVLRCSLAIHATSPTMPCWLGTSPCAASLAVPDGDVCAGCAVCLGRPQRLDLLSGCVGI